MSKYFAEQCECSMWMNNVKAHLKGAASGDISKLAAKPDLASVKFELDKLDLI